MIIPDDSPILVYGQPYLNIPESLYIPPEALRIFLESFEGPLDLLLYLIKKQNINILDIPIAEITRQYVEYVELMKNFALDLAAEYLVMAVMLAEIKSKMLLPKPPQIDENGDVDPRNELVRKLQEYEKYKGVTNYIDELPRLERDLFLPNIDITNLPEKPLPNLVLNELQSAWIEVASRFSGKYIQHIQKDALSVRERMAEVLMKLEGKKYIRFTEILHQNEDKLGIVVAFVAILELLKQSMINLMQETEFSEVYIYNC
jgi:segregation and condensation protein A